MNNSICDKAARLLLPIVKMILVYAAECSISGLKLNR
jgi:hypothetical protein